MQSPIDLDIRIANGAELGNFKLENLFRRNFCVLSNTTQTVQLDFRHDCYLSDGPLSAKYKFRQMHFHWGRDENDGTEHTIQGKKFALEAHFVFEYEYQFKAPVEILEANKKLSELKWKIDHPDEEEEEEDTDDEAEEEEEEETEEEMMERYERDSRSLEILTTKKMEEWAEKRRHIILNDKYEGAADKQYLMKSITPAQKQAKRAAWEDVWDSYKRDAIRGSNILLTERVWSELKEKYGLSKEAAEITRNEKLKKPISQSMEKPTEEKQKTKALRLETDLMSRQEYAGLEQSKNVYIEWKKAEDQLDKRLKRQLREDFEAYLEEIEERDELEDDADIPEDEKKRTRIRWTIMDEQKEQASRAKLKAVLDRRKRELDEMCTKNITVYSVIALLFKADETAPPYDLFSYLSFIKKPWEQLEVDGNLIAPFESGLNTGEYFTYAGSITLSPFSENVTWICMRDPLLIHPKQLKALRELKNEFGKIESNIREIQSLGAREVYFNQKPVMYQAPPCPGKELCQCDPANNNWTKFI